MASEISALPNEVSQKNNVVMKVEETNKKVPNPPQQEPISVQPQTTELSQESIHQIVQGLQQAGGATVLPNREIPTNNNAHLTQDEQIKPNFIPKAENENYIEEERSMEDLIKQSQNKKVEQDRLTRLVEHLSKKFTIHKDLIREWMETFDGTTEQLYDYCAKYKKMNPETVKFLDGKVAK